MDSFNFALENKIKYANKGEEVDGSFIELRAPTYKQLEHTVPLKQFFFQAAKQQAGTVDPDKASDEDIDVSGEELMMLIFSSSVDAKSFILHGVELMKQVGYMEGLEKLTTPMLELMHQDDLENMIGTYLVNFTLASTLRKGGKN